MASVLASCTAKFEEYNTNPYGPTPEQMVGDGANVGSLIMDMQQVLVQGHQNRSHIGLTEIDTRQDTCSYLNMRPENGED